MEKKSVHYTEPERGNHIPKEDNNVNICIYNNMLIMLVEFVVFTPYAPVLNNARKLQLLSYELCVCVCVLVCLLYTSH